MLSGHALLRKSVFFLLAALLYLSFFSATYSHANQLTLPQGFQIKEFAKGLDKPRFMATSPDEVLFAALMGKGLIAALPDGDRDGRADRVIKFLGGLDLPNSIEFHSGYLYVGESTKITRVKYNGFDKKPGRKEVIVPDLPSEGHFTKTIGFGPDGKLYVSMGSSCNVCIEADERRATIMRYNPDGSGGEVFARGLRNSVGFEWHPVTRELWASDNGRDWLGDDLPPEEVNIVREGGHYGWPYCYGDGVVDPKFGTPEICEKTIPPVFQMQAHSAPLGVAFYTGKKFPASYHNDLFIAFHGSWNRTEPTGYKVVRIKIKNDRPIGSEDFVSGWLKGQRAWGRPADVHVGIRGEMYISDDRGGRIYIVTYGQ